MSGGRFLLALALLSAFACGRAATELAASTTSGASGSTGSVAKTSRDVPRVIFLGDSLTTGAGLPSEDSFPAVLARRLADEGLPIELVNAGVGGNTSRDGLRRLPFLLGKNPDVLVIGLGGNDGLRRHPIEDIRENLTAIVRRTRDAGVEVLLLGLELPPRLGIDYTRAFRDNYTEIAEEFDVALVPSMLAGVGARRHLNLPDGIHPNAEGQRLVAENVLPYLRELVR